MTPHLLLNSDQMPLIFPQEVFLSAARALFGRDWLYELSKENLRCLVQMSSPPCANTRMSFGRWCELMRFLMKKSNLTLSELIALGEKQYLLYDAALLGSSYSEHFLMEDRPLRYVSERPYGVSKLEYLKAKRELLNKEIAQLEATAAEEERKKNYTALAVERVKLLDKRDLARRAAESCEKRVKEIEKELGL